MLIGSPCHKNLSGKIFAPDRRRCASIVMIRRRYQILSPKSESLHKVGTHPVKIALVNIHNIRFVLKHNNKIYLRIILRDW